ncbi:MAG: hypothetical protein LBS52_03955 [Dysgonamonadaceae bacterium]|jgi:hypothetical protein|nr:hypothetical protein [Dysgonamonadaceae bacterium]
MKKRLFYVVAALVMGTSVFAQEPESKWTTGADVVSSYVWRGLYLSGVSVQPAVSFSTNGFTIGGWGSANFNGSSLEADLFASYAFDFGLSLGLTDYYFPSIEDGNDYFEYSKEAGSHIFELNAGYEVSGFSVSANYVFNEAGGAGSAGGDKYFELGYTYKNVNFFVGAGDGLQSSDGEFKITNIGLSASKEIEITPSFTVPLTGSVILNPDTKKFFLVAAVSF